MDVRRRSTMDTPAPKARSGPMKVKVVDHENDVVVVGAKASDALPLPLYLTNAVFFTLFFSVVYFLLTRWREKIRTSTPLHVVDLSEIVAIVAFVASFIYLLGFNKPSSRGGFFQRRSKFSPAVGCAVVGPPLKCCRATRPEACVKATRLIKQKSSPVLGSIRNRPGCCLAWAGSRAVLWAGSRAVLWAGGKKWEAGQYFDMVPVKKCSIGAALRHPKPSLIRTPTTSF